MAASVEGWGTRENHRQAPAPTHNVSKEWNPAHVPLPPDERKAKARVGVGQLESALKAVDPSDPAAVVLQEALRKAQSQARVPPIESQLKVVEEYFEQKEETSFSRCGSHCEARSFPSRGHRGGEEFGEITKRAPKVASFSCQMPWTFPHRMLQPRWNNCRQGDCAVARRRTQRLLSSSKRQAVSSVSKEREGRLREDFVPKCDEEVVQWMRDRQADMQDATSAGNAHATVVPKLWPVQRTIAQEFSHIHGRERDQLRRHIQSVIEGSCVLRISRYGLRGCSVGEASNPGPRVKSRRRVESSSQQSESDFSDLSDGLEISAWRRHLTVVVHGARQRGRSVVSVHSPRIISSSS